ncbi:MAG TPA: hypothetical protein PKW59_10460 [Thermotogota bacterium]|nr:hypothetical protein [Thermotogota bacterium]
MKRWIIPFLSMLVILTACMLKSEKGLVTLEVLDPRGIPVSYAQVEWVSSEGFSFFSVCDAQGIVKKWLPFGNYSVTVEDGFFYNDFSLEVVNSSSHPVCLSAFKESTIAVVSRWEGRKVVSKLAADSRVIFAALELHGVEWNSEETPLITLPKEKEAESQRAFWVNPNLSSNAAFYLAEVPDGLSVKILEVHTQSSLSEQASQENPSPIIFRAIIPPSQLRNAGDLCQGSGMVSGQDGLVNVWDLIYLLNRYKTYDVSADIGRLGDTITLPPNGPFQANVNPDGYVDVWDLILLLNAYGASWEKINTPFQPVIDTVSALVPSGSYSIQWHPIYAQDVHEQYRLYDLNDPSEFSTTTAALTTVSKSVSQTVFSTVKQYVALCAVNTSLGQPFTFFSSPTFHVLTPGPQPHLSFETSSYSVPAGSTIIVRVLAQGVALFQTIEVSLGYTGNLQALGIAMGPVFNTNARLVNGQTPITGIFAHATHLFGQNSSLASGVLLTYSIVANTSGTLFFNRGQAIDASLNATALQTGPMINIQVF